MTDTLTQKSMSFAEAMQLLDVAHSTMRSHITKRRLTPLTPPYTPLAQVRFERAQVEALAHEIAQWKQDRSLASQIVDGKKRCSKCRLWLPAETDFCKASHTKLGVAAWCKACTAQSSREWYQSNWTRERAKRDAYKQSHREQFRVYRRRAYHRDPRKGYLQHKRWVESNREHAREYMRLYRRTKDALAWGLCSPITRAAGFALVVNNKGQWRAARLDMPFGAGEIGIAEFLPPLTASGRWLVRPWRVLEPRWRSIAERICKRFSQSQKGALHA